METVRIVVTALVILVGGGLTLLGLTTLAAMARKAMKG